MKYTESSQEENLFPGKNRHLNACINYMPLDYAYIWGYRKTAKLLIDHVVETRLDQDKLIYPIIFSYRQTIELLIKRIIKDFQRVNGLKCTIEKGHNIKSLFEKYNQIFIDYGGVIKTNKCLDILNKISLVDPNSESSRYSIDLNGNPSIKIKDHIINIETFSVEAEKVLIFLDEINTLLDNELDNG